MHFSNPKRLLNCGLACALLACAALVTTSCTEIPTEIYGDWELVAIDGVPFDDLKESLSYTGFRTPNISISDTEFGGYNGCNSFSGFWNRNEILSTLVGCGLDGDLPLDIRDLEKHLSNATANGDILSVPGKGNYPPSTYRRR